MHELGIIVHVMRTVEEVGIHDRLLGLCKKQIRAFKRLRIKNRDHTWCYHV